MNTPDSVDARPSCPICATCGTQFAPAARLPDACPICEDERQYVGWSGQRWTTHEALAESRTVIAANAVRRLLRGTAREVVPVAG